MMLGLSAAAGILAAGVQWHHPFSNAGTTAAWLRAHHLAHAALVGTLDTSVAAVAEELQRPIYFLDCNCSSRFLLFSTQRDAFRWDQIPDRLVVASRQLHAPEMILILSDRLSDTQRSLIERHFRVSSLAEFTSAEEAVEDFYLYRLEEEQ